MDRYIFRQLAVTTLLVAVAFTGVVWLSQSLKLIDMIVNRGLSASLFLYMSVLVLPSFMSLVLPVALFTAVMFVYNKLITDNELVVLRAAGFSQWAVAGPALKLAVLVMVLTYSATLYFMPVSFRVFSEIKHVVRDTYTTVVLQEGVFNSLADGVTVYVRRRAPNGELLGLMIHDEREPDRPVTMMAERGALVPGESGPRVLLLNGNRQQVPDGGGTLSLLYFDRYVFEISRPEDPIAGRWREPHERFLPELFFPAREATRMRDYHKLRMEGHNRLVTPLYALSFTIVGLVCMLYGEFNRRGRSRRIFIAMGAVLAIQLAGVALRNTGIKSPDTTPLFYANALVPVLLGCLALFAAPRRRIRPPLSAAR